MIRPKNAELSIYEGIPHLASPVITQTKRGLEAPLKIVGEMQRRYKLLAEKGVRNIDGYNNMIASEVRIKDSALRQKGIT